METLLLGTTDSDISKAAELIKSGEVVAIPTETVYGLAANAFDENAVKKIFAAKNRPCDNPLIVHISNFDMVYDIAESVPELAYECAEFFWAGPLTMIMPKKDTIPLVTSGGLDTVGIRFPSNKVAQKIIERCGLPLAAPSANLSGSPSPTNAARVMEDMSGRISAVVDGGESDVGVESTVITFENDGIRILRPGGISREDLLRVCDNVIIDEGVSAKLPSGTVARSPGMKYKHYSPKADVILIDSDIDSFRKYVVENKTDNTYCLLFDEGEVVEGVPYLTYGDDSIEQAHNLFERLRQFDEMGAERVYARCPEQSGVGLAVYNRILRSAGFNLIKL
ncbi:MAG: threonylcarbamoyl-AMP synthase [Oscillospiraceae bacterium]|nr:threonylcarbamoyl-AMP synthase [Oscillospiraceae bacterium]